MTAAARKPRHTSTRYITGETFKCFDLDCHIDHDLQSRDFPMFVDEQIIGYAHSAAEARTTIHAHCEELARQTRADTADAEAERAAETIETLREQLDAAIDARLAAPMYSEAWDTAQAEAQRCVAALDALREVNALAAERYPEGTTWRVAAEVECERIDALRSSRCPTCASDGSACVDCNPVHICAPADLNYPGIPTDPAPELGELDAHCFACGDLLETDTDEPTLCPACIQVGETIDLQPEPTPEQQSARDAENEADMLDFLRSSAPPPFNPQALRDQADALRARLWSASQCALPGDRRLRLFDLYARAVERAERRHRTCPACGQFHHIQQCAAVQAALFADRAPQEMHALWRSQRPAFVRWLRSLDQGEFHRAARRFAAHLTSITGVTLQAASVANIWRAELGQPMTPAAA